MNLEIGVKSESHIRVVQLFDDAVLQQTSFILFTEAMDGIFQLKQALLIGSLCCLFSLQLLQSHDPYLIVFTFIHEVIDPL